MQGRLVACEAVTRRIVRDVLLGLARAQRLEVKARDHALRQLLELGTPGADLPMHLEGFDTVLVEAGCRAIDLAGSLDAAWAGMATACAGRRFFPEAKMIAFRHPLLSLRLK